MAGSASNLLGLLPASQLTGQVPAATLPAGLLLLSTNNAGDLTNLSAPQLIGVIPASALPANLATLNANDGSGLVNLQPGALPPALQFLNDNNGASALCATDLLTAYNQLNATVPTSFPAPLLGNGQTLTSGVYSISSASTLNLDLILDGLGNANAVFIFQIQGPLSTNANSKVKLVNIGKPFI